MVIISFRALGGDDLKDAASAGGGHPSAEVHVRRHRHVSMPQLDPAARDGAYVASLAVHAEHVPRRVSALAWRQQAHVRAAAGDERGCREANDPALWSTTARR
jgi:hypothetical protein